MIDYFSKRLHADNCLPFGESQDDSSQAESEAREIPKFKSRLSFKAISEIFIVMIKRELTKKGINSGNID